MARVDSDRLSAADLAALSLEAEQAGVMGSMPVPISTPRMQIPPGRPPTMFRAVRCAFDFGYKTIRVLRRALRVPRFVHLRLHVHDPQLRLRQYSVHAVAIEGDAFEGRVRLGIACVTANQAVRGVA